MDYLKGLRGLKEKLDKPLTKLEAARLYGGGSGSVAWSGVTGKPSTFPPEAHTHLVADVTGLQGALDGKALASHVHPATGISDSTAAGRSMLTAADAAAQTALLSVATASVKGLMPASDKSKLDGVSSGATANATDAALRDRSTHTGTQAVGTITGLAAIATSGSAADLAAGEVPAARMPAHTGDVTSSAGSVALTIANGVVSLAKMANVSTSVILGRITAGAGVPEALTGTQVTTLLDTFTSGLKGLAPASGGGTTNFLRADGTWAAPAGGATYAYGQLTSDYTLTSQTAAQKLFNFSANVALTLSTGRYLFRAIIYLTGMSATSGNAAFSFAGTATLANILYHVTGIDNSSPLNAGTRTGSASVTSASVASMVSAATGTGMVAIIEGMVNVTVTGTVIPSIALVTAAAAIVKAGSFFECIRVGDTGSNTQGSWS